MLVKDRLIGLVFGHASHLIGGRDLLSEVLECIYVIVIVIHGIVRVRTQNETSVSSLGQMSLLLRAILIEIAGNLTL